MTRINCVPVQELSGPHLVAEYRELPRVFALVRKAALRGSFSQPETYTLGKGHVLFFYTRLEYLAKCRVPDDQVSHRSYPLLAARGLLQQFIREQVHGHQAA